MKSAGLILKQAREAQGLSVEDMARVTRISRSIIVAIEHEDTDALPADVYVRGFTRNLAAVLGLDPSEVIQKQAQVAPPVRTPAQVERADEQRFSMLFGQGINHSVPLGGTHLVMALLAIGMFLAAWFLVGDQAPTQDREHDLQSGVPAIQESVDAVTPFTAQGLRADARR